MAAFLQGLLIDWFDRIGHVVIGGISRLAVIAVICACVVVKLWGG